MFPYFFIFYLKYQKAKLNLAQPRFLPTFLIHGSGHRAPAADRLAGGPFGTDGAPEGEQRAAGERGAGGARPRPGLWARLQLHRRCRSPAARRDPGIFPLKRSSSLLPEAWPPAFLPRSGGGSALVLRPEVPPGHRAFRVRSSQPCRLFPPPGLEPAELQTGPLASPRCRPHTDESLPADAG